ncbi:MAG: 4-hydroxy-tetrahydrodipicolinate reductase [Christensenellaceae bacterium]|jgi:4-hydroxy-tetrahydrodipicolinate reductase|nr:4-hydroxy-tetrahydrodipicolinate reductase [Christensenellaceae bacterium]
MNILIYGIGGKMGKTLLTASQNTDDIKAVAGVDVFADPTDYNIPVYKSINQTKESFECIIDFSAHEAVFDILPFAISKKIPCVLATTGYNEDELDLIDKAAQTIPIFKTGNMSLGINVLSKLVMAAANMLENADAEIIETHHNQKVDAPSGTALMLLHAIEDSRGPVKPIFGRSGISSPRDSKEVGIHAIRGGSVVGKHSVMFMMNNEVLTLTHEAENKIVFANGAIDAARFLVDRTEAGIYNMNHLLNTRYS